MKTTLLYKNTLKTQRGLTLIELMVVLAVAAILLTMGIPQFQDTIKRNRVLTHQHDLLAAIKSARREAVDRGDLGANGVVTICGYSSDRVCTTDGDWSRGWIVFVDNGAGTSSDAGDETIDANEQVLKVYTYSGTNTVRAVNSQNIAVPSISFNSKGQALNPAAQGVNATIRICEVSNEERYARALVIGASGRVGRSFDLNGDGVFEDVNGTNLACAG